MTKKTDAEIEVVETEVAEPKKSKKTETVSEATTIAQSILAAGRNSRWGSGRDRDEMLAKAGHDPEAVRREISRLRGEKLSQSR